MMKRWISAALCIALLISMFSIPVCAQNDALVVDGIRWSPCQAGKENDEIWEVQSGKDPMVFQNFENGTDHQNYLNTAYDENGALILTRSGADGEEVYAPCVRTVATVMPKMDWHTADTLYFNVDALYCSWNLYFSISNTTVKLGHALAETTGNLVDDGGNSDDDAPAGGYVGSINIIDTLNAIAKENTDSADAAKAILEMSTTVVPQITIVYNGTTDGSLTIKDLFMSTAADTEGTACDFLTMDFINGEDSDKQPLTTTAAQTTTTALPTTATQASLTATQTETVTQPTATTAADTTAAATVPDTADSSHAVIALFIAASALTTALLVSRRRLNK